MIAWCMVMRTKETDVNVGQKLTTPARTSPARTSPARTSPARTRMILVRACHL